MKSNWFAFTLCALLLTAACSNEDRASTPTYDETPTVASQSSELTPEQLGELGAQIRKTPNDAQRLLAARGLNAESFEKAVRKVSEDPAASKRYADSYKKAGA